MKALDPIDARNAAALTVRGQYRAGASNGGAVQSYAQDVGSRQQRDRDFRRAEGRCRELALGRDALLSAHGQAPAAKRVSEVIVAFRQIPHSIFNVESGRISKTRLVVRLQPDEGIKLWLMLKEPGAGGMRLRYVPLDMNFADAFQIYAPEAYERLLMDVIRGNATLFMRRDEVEAAWRWIDPIREAWSQLHEPPRPYFAGTWGPAAAIALVERDGRSWNEDIM